MNLMAKRKKMAKGTSQLRSSAALEPVKTSGVVEDNSHTPLSNHRQHDEGLNFITACYGNEWAVAGSECVTVITTLQQKCE